MLVFPIGLLQAFQFSFFSFSFDFVLFLFFVLALNFCNEDKFFKHPFIQVQIQLMWCTIGARFVFVVEFALRIRHIQNCNLAECEHV